MKPASVRMEQTRATASVTAKLLVWGPRQVSHTEARENQLPGRQRLPGQLRRRRRASCVRWGFIHGPASSHSLTGQYSRHLSRSFSCRRTWTHLVYHALWLWLFFCLVPITIHIYETSVFMFDLFTGPQHCLQEQHPVEVRNHSMMTLLLDTTEKTKEY